MNDYQRIARAIEFISANFREQPDLASVAAHVGLSEYHFQRLFRRWAGISPKRFVQYLTADYARSLLASDETVLDASYDAGLSGPGRLHDLMVNIHAVTPGEIRAGGEGLTIQYGMHQTRFGEAFIAMTERGVTALRFVDTDSADHTERLVLEEIQSAWPLATLVHAPQDTQRVIARIFKTSDDEPLTLWLRGTNFQIRVWEALLAIPTGQAVTYQHIARAIGQPEAVRAVGSAVGANPIALLIPCHRVLRKSGGLGGYRWGATRKQAVLAYEGAVRDTRRLQQRDLETA
jgi:AraC family transcriptional regulator of adaptative response/methylated-DNA-[protein]-cysteine methyltransferase